MQTMRHCMQVLEFVKSKGVEVRFHGRGKNEASHYCGQCEVSSPLVLLGFLHGMIVETLLTLSQLILKVYFCTALLSGIL